MILSKYITGVLFIDDKKEDVIKLIEYFDLYNIWSKTINPAEIREDFNYNYSGVRLVFLDLQYDLSGSSEIPRAVNILRDLSSQGVKNYILVVWSMHDNEIEDLKKCIEEKMLKDKPSIILSADKNSCLKITDGEFKNKMDELFSESIEENPLLYKLLEWEKEALFASRDTINDIIALSYNKTNSTFDLNKVLNAMSLTSSGDHKLKSALSYAHDILSDNIVKYSEKIDYDLDDVMCEEQLQSQLNSFQMFKKDLTNKSIPGDIYESNIDDADKETLLQEINISFGTNLKINQILPIQVDLTPPCTSLKTDKSILIHGYIIENYDEQIKKKIQGAKKNYMISFYFDDKKQQKNVLVFDFIKINYINKTGISLKKIYCLKNAFRSSLQQQFGSFLTRIGDNIIHIK